MIDRSNLAKLYPEVAVNKQDNKSNTPLADKIGVKIPFWRILIIAISLTVAIVSLILLSNYLNQSVDMNDITNLISRMIEMLLIGASVLIMVFISILWNLKRTDVNMLIFSIVYALYALPTSQLTYNLFYRFGNKSISLVPFSVTLFVENLIFVFFIVKIMNSKKVSGTAKMVMIVSTIIYSSLIVFIANIVKI